MYKDKAITSEYNTPLYLFNYLNKHFHFSLDPCATEDNYLGTEYYFSQKEGFDGLEQSWSVNTFVNPPYGAGNERLWIDKAIKEFERFKANIFLLLPAKTEASWFSQLFRKSTIVIFPQKRINFVRNGKKINGNTIGSVIFGLVREYDECLMTNAERQVTSFIEENRDLKIPMVLGDGKYIFFPDRKILENEYQKKDINPKLDLNDVPKL